MTNIVEPKNKKTLYWYFGAVMVLGIIALIVTSTVGNIKSARIVNMLCLVLTPIVFFGGYVDFRNYKPLSKKQEQFYIVIGILSLTMSLIHYNVENNCFLQNIVIKGYYNPILSIFAALTISIGFNATVLVALNRNDEKKKSKLFFAIAISSIITNFLFTIFNYGTDILLLNGVMSVFGSTGFVVDIGMTVLVVSVLFIYIIFLGRARKENKLGIVAQQDSMFQPKITRLVIVGLILLVLNILILALLESINTKDDVKRYVIYLLSQIVEITTTVGLIIVGLITCQKGRKNKKFKNVYAQIGVSAIIFAVTNLVMDYFPIILFFNPESDAQATMIFEVFRSSVKTLSLLVFTIFLYLNGRAARQNKAGRDENLC
ncbi:MAG: hypothetical protein RR357_02360 [Clostridia bacterium]